MLRPVQFGMAIATPDHKLLAEALRAVSRDHFTEQSTRLETELTLATGANTKTAERAYRLIVLSHANRSWADTIPRGESENHAGYQDVTHRIESAMHAAMGELDTSELRALHQRLKKNGIADTPRFLVSSMIERAIKVRSLHDLGVKLQANLDKIRAEEPGDKGAHHRAWQLALLIQGDDDTRRHTKLDDQIYEPVHYQAYHIAYNAFNREVMALDLNSLRLLLRQMEEYHAASFSHQLTASVVGSLNNKLPVEEYLLVNDKVGTLKEEAAAQDAKRLNVTA